MNVNANVQSKKLWFLGMFVGYSFKQNDFYEPRTAGWYFKRGASIDLESWFESNQSKKYSYLVDVSAHRSIHFYHSSSLNAEFEQSYRFNNKLTLSQDITYAPAINDIGYTYIDGSTDINFARRTVNVITHIVSAKYNFTNRMGITFRARHYVSTVSNKEFFLLQHDGGLASHAGYHPAADQNVNYFNIDMVYTWQFAPGSFLNIVWKDASQDYTPLVQRNYFKNFGNSITDDSNNNFSIKLIYFLDVLKLRKGLHQQKS
jgi:hypothetical protein